MRIPPTNSYCGLTLVLSNPSRKDTNGLLQGYAGVWWNESCLRPDYNRWQCDIRTSNERTGILPNTKAIVLFGDRALHEWCPNYADYTVSEQRGCRLSHSFGEQTTVICTFAPQDAIDVVDWEAKFNPLATADDDSASNEESDEKHKGKTSRYNYSFWIKEDFRKVKHILSSRSRTVYPSPRTEFCIYPNIGELVSFLTKTKGQSLFLDIETDPDQNITCIGCGFDPSRILVIPILTYNYTPAYSNLGKVFRALAIGMRDNEVVCHNALFDLFILAWKYQVPVGHKIYDTMLAHKRAWPEVEKSLGHAMSHLCYEPYHKDAGIFLPQSEQQQRTLWQYNGNDVRGTMLVKGALDEYASKTRGLPESIEQANSCIRGDLINTLQGIRYSEEERSKLFRENDRLMMQYLRVLKHLVGYEFLPSSPKQCIDYFHNSLGYPVVSRNEKTKAPSLGKDNIYKLKLKHPDNPVLDFTLAFRRLSKQSGTLKFIPWKSEPTPQ